MKQQHDRRTQRKEHMQQHMMMLMQNPLDPKYQEEATLLPKPPKVMVPLSKGKSLDYPKGKKLGRIGKKTQLSERELPAKPTSHI